MGTESIISKAPTRIDLAGGTVDLWPLYLFIDQATTINLGIDLFAEARIDLDSSKEPKIKLISKDQGYEMEFSWQDLAQRKLTPHPALELHYKLLKFFHEKKQGSKQGASDEVHLTLSTQAKSPAGAGLGGSSTLSVAMVGALSRWANQTFSQEALIEIVRDVETTVIQVPAGLQDYYGAMFGGLQSIQWGIGSHQRKGLPEDLLKELNQRIILFYSGQSRNSGINNWILFKNFIDRQANVRTQFEEISRAAQKLEKALLNRNWKDVGTAIAEEWSVRKTLAPGITTPEIDLAFSEAKKLAPISGKVCGAGGGGCFYIYNPDPIQLSELKSKIIETFAHCQIRHLPFQSVTRGLEVHVTRT